jgi:molybdopterin adenylyltransferase
MPRIWINVKSLNLRFAILTISDRSSQGLREDLSGPTLNSFVKKSGWEVSCMKIIPDDFQQIKTSLLMWCDQGDIDVILTTGGTGFSPRDVTPEATQEVIEKNAPGLAEVMRMESLKKTPHAMLSRACAGIRDSTLIINLPGSPKAAEENLSAISSVLPHAVQLLQNQPVSDGDHGFNI